MKSCTGFLVIPQVRQHMTLFEWTIKEYLLFLASFSRHNPNPNHVASMYLGIGGGT